MNRGLIIFCLAMFFGQASAMEYYIVEKGDCISTIAVKVNTTVCGLLSLNRRIYNQKFIFPGQRIAYLTDNDLARAKAWAKKNMKKDEGNDYDEDCFVAAISDDYHISNSVYANNGMYASVILNWSMGKRY
jgi:hypothetical protein